VTRIEASQGDISHQDTDAIVNAANATLLGGGGVDGAIHRAAGGDLLLACRALPELRPGVRCPTGDARITPGFALSARWVIHTVGPVYHQHPDPRGALAQAHRSCLTLAVANGVRTIAFPAISTGAYGYPVPEAARIAVGVAREPGWDLDLVRFVLFGERALRAWERALA
jgi:O-acetyl-ADP-ribose deacetylase